MKKRSDDSGILLESITRGIFEKRGLDVIKIDLRKIETRISDYFVICHGTSATQVDAICESVEDTVRISAGEKPLHVEGLENCFWVLLDYGNVLVHIFLEEYRSFYSLETLWADGSIEALADNI